MLQLATLVSTPRRLLLLLAVAAVRASSASVTPVSPPVMSLQEMQAYMLQTRLLMVEIATTIMPQMKLQIDANTLALKGGHSAGETTEHTEHAGAAAGKAEVNLAGWALYAQAQGLGTQRLNVTEALTVDGVDIGTELGRLGDAVEELAKKSAVVDAGRGGSKPQCRVLFNNTDHCRLLLSPLSDPDTVRHGDPIDPARVVCEVGFVPPATITWDCDGLDGWGRPSARLAMPLQCKADADPDLSGALENGGSWLATVSGAVESGDPMDPKWIGMGFEARNVTEQVLCACPPC